LLSFSTWGDDTCLDTIEEVLLSGQVSRIENQIISESFQKENKTITNEYEKWLENHNPEELVTNDVLDNHIVSPRLNLNDEAKLISGMHTIKGVLELLRLRSDLVPSKIIRDKFSIDLPKECQLGKCYEYSFTITLNGVIKLHLPNEAFNKHGRNATLSATLQGENTYLTKTIFPASIDQKSLRATLLRVMNEPDKVVDQGRLTLYEGIGIDQVRTVVVYNNELEKIVSAYPSFFNQGGEFRSTEIYSLYADIPKYILRDFEQRYYPPLGSLSDKKRKALRKIIIKSIEINGFSSQVIDLNKFLSSGIFDVTQENYHEVVKRILNVFELKSLIDYFRFFYFPKSEETKKIYNENLSILIQKIKKYLYDGGDYLEIYKEAMDLSSIPNLTLNEEALLPIYYQMKMEMGDGLPLN
jgi:hypothetical protein